MKICAATGNAGKLRELRRILEAQGHEVVSQKELGITIEPDETGTTFAENALIKAETICKVSGLPTIADDSGLCVDALGGAPGVYSARYCGHHGDDEANNDKLLDAMKEVPEGKRGAKFVSAVCFILPDGRHLTCMGECPGSIAFERLNGDYGFGYDPLFIPADCGVGKRDKRPNTEHRSYAQLTPDEKDAISHRGNALAVLEKQLPEGTVLSVVLRETPTADNGLTPELLTACFDRVYVMPEADASALPTSYDAATRVVAMTAYAPDSGSYLVTQ